MATEAHRLRGQYWHLFKVKKQGTEDGDFLHCTDCWSTFLPTAKGTEHSFSTLLSGSAALWHSQPARGFLRGNCSHLSLLKNWKSRKPSLASLVGSQQDTSSFCVFCSILLRLGILVLTVLWKVETLERVELLQRQPWHFQIHHQFHIPFWPKNWKKWDLCYPWQSTKSLKTK